MGDSFFEAWRLLPRQSFPSIPSVKAGFSLDTQSQQVSQAQQVRTTAAQRPKASRRAAPFIFILCLLVAVSTVLFVPMFFGGAATASSTVAAASIAQPQAEQNFARLSDAAAALGFTPLSPRSLPQGYELTAISGLSGGILELQYTSGRESITFRTAPGTDDLSGTTAEAPYTATEGATGIAYSFSGKSEQKLTEAVWTQGDASYAILSSTPLSADAMHSMAASLA